eukprot:1058394-Heterocapsa_arctica.AAC.1
MGSYPPAEKGPTIEHIGKLRAETSWMEIGVEQRIGQIGKFLTNNRSERMTLLRWGAIRLNVEEAKLVIEEQLHFGTHFMDSPRTRTDRNFRI